MKWQKLPDKEYQGLTVHEVKCPKCNYKETYTSTLPEKCYICEEVRNE